MISRMRGEPLRKVRTAPMPSSNEPAAATGKRGDSRTKAMRLALVKSRSLLVLSASTTSGAVLVPTISQMCEENRRGGASRRSGPC